MPSVSDHGAFFGKCFQGMAWNEPGGFDFVFLEHLEEPANTHGPSEQTFPR